MKILKLAIVLILACHSAFSQDYKFGKVELKEVQENTYAKDTSAAAVILYKDRLTYFSYEHPDGWVIITETQERIKILKKEGLVYATKNIDLYKSGKNDEIVLQIKGYTYNDESGKVDSEKLKNNGIFKNELTDNWDRTSFTMPNAKVGSVVEWTYKVSSPFWKIDDLIFQQDIPIKHYVAVIKAPAFFNFKRIVRGDFNMVPKDYSENRTLTVSYEQDTNRALTQATKTSRINMMEFVSEYEFRDVDALVAEPYVDNIKNYLPSITYELQSTEFPDQPVKKYSTSWDEVVKTINKDENFGEQLEKTRFLKEDIENLKSKSNGEIETMNNVFNFVKNKMTWNEKYGKYTKKGLQDAYKEGSGNVAEINLLLLSLLRECGVNANPVLVSTRDHGIPLFPTLEGFNYVVVGASINNKLTLMDATEKLSVPNVLPQRALNWEGTLVMQNGGSEKVRLYPETASAISTIMNIEINSDGAATGQLKSNYSDLEALSFRKSFNNVNTDEHMQSIMSKYKLSDLTNLSVENKDDLEKSVVESYDFKILEGVDIIGEDMYFSPLFFLKLNENPFKLDKRNYPMDFGSPMVIRKIIAIRIPEGYQISSLPEAVKIILPDNQGSFLFNINDSGGGINIMTEFKINRAIIPAFKYGEIKEFFNLRLKKESEQIVLKKV